MLKPPHPLPNRAAQTRRWINAAYDDATKSGTAGGLGGRARPAASPSTPREVSDVSETAIRERIELRTADNAQPAINDEMEKMRIDRQMIPKCGNAIGPTEVRAATRMRMIEHADLFRKWRRRLEGELVSNIKAKRLF
jgi:hypothetical protein